MDKISQQDAREDRPAAVVASSTDEATGTFGRRFDVVRVVAHADLSDLDPLGFSVLAVGSADPAGFRRTVARVLEAVQDDPAAPDLLLDLGTASEAPAAEVEKVLGHLEGYEVLGLERLGHDRIGVRLGRNGGGPALTPGLRGLLRDATSLARPAERQKPAAEPEDRVRRLEQRAAHQRTKIAELERRLAKGPRRSDGAGAATRGGVPAGPRTDPPPAKASVAGRGARVYVAALTRVLPSLKEAGRGARSAAVATSVVVLLLLGLLPPALMLLLESGRLRDSLLTLMLEGLGILVVAVALVVRRASGSAREAGIAAREARNQARHAARGARRTAQKIRAVGRRAQRQGERLARMDRSLRGVRRNVSQTVANQPSREELHDLESRLLQSQEDQLRQNQALVNLFELVDVRAAVPPLGGWAASPDLALLLVDEVVRRRPRTVVECGSGSSTLMFALAAARHDLPTRIVSLEHDSEFAEATRDLLRRHGVERYADVRHAPLRATSLGDHRAPWYDESALHDIEDVGLLFVDGPPRSTGTRARYPAVPLLRDHFSAEVTIIVDDADRPDEQAIAELWREQLPDFSFDTLALEKGAIVMRRG